MSRLKCREKADSKNPRVAKVNKGKQMVLSECAVCDTKHKKNKKLLGY